MSVEVYPKASDLSKKIDEYFEVVQTRKISKYRPDGQIFTYPEPYSVMGLAAHLGVSTDTIQNLQKKSPDHFVAIKKAKDKILKNVAEQALINNYNPVIAKLILGSLGLKDESAVNLNHSGAISNRVQIEFVNSSSFDDDSEDEDDNNEI